MGLDLKKNQTLRHIEEMAVACPFLEAKVDSKDRMKKIFVRKGKICKFQDNVWKVVATIEKMLTDTIQKEFFFVRILKEWTFMGTWSHLKT